MPDPAVMKGVLRHLRRTERRRLYDLLGDGELLARFLADRDEAAFEELVCRHGPMVRGVCRRVLGPTADADDAFQAAFLVLLRKARSIRRTDLLANWLCAVAYRTARQALRRRYRVGARERTGDDLPELCRPDDPPRDWLPLFDAALQRLPSKYRDPVVLCDLKGLSRPEAAKHLGLNEGTLSSRLGRARDLLRRKLSPYGFPLAVGTALAPAVVPEALTASTAAAAVNVGAASVSAIVLTEGVITAMFASKLKAGAACTVVLLVGTVAGFQLTGPVTLAGGPAKDGPASKEAAKGAAKPEPTSARTAEAKRTRLSAEYEPFQGEWEVWTAESGEGTGAAAVGIDDRWKFTGTALTTGGEIKEDAAAPFTVNDRANPPTIDFTLTAFHPHGTGVLVLTEFHGIYRFESDGGLTICYRMKREGSFRPTRFATAKNSGVTLITLRRPKAEVLDRVEDGVRTGVSDVAIPIRFAKEETKPAGAKNADLAQVIGAWELADVDGQAPDATARKLDQGQIRPDGTGIVSHHPQRWEQMRRLYLLPGGGPTTLTYQPAVALCLAYVDLDGTKSPKWITLQATEQRPPVDAPGAMLPPAKSVRLCGIYSFDEDKLVMCLPEAEVSSLLRPTDFKGDGEGGLYVLTYKRAAKQWTPETRSDPQLAAPAFVDSGTVPPGALAPTPTVAVPTIPVANTPTDSSLPPAADGPATIPPPNVPMNPVGPAPVAADFAFPVSPATAPAPSDLDQLQGAWAMVKRDGQPRPPDGKDEVLEFVKDRVLVSTGRHGRVRIDVSRDPKQMTLDITVDGKTDFERFIYKLEGDTLTLAGCHRSNKLVPIDFEPDQAAGIEVAVYERIKGPRPVKVPDGGVVGGMTLPSPRLQTGTPARQYEPPHSPATPDLRKEVDELREQIKRLEKLLQDRPPH